ncbi:MAG: hypothetical protein GXP62_07605 [Oligoflexia bacterium]|nr:hypothetical protein [Oligoflexia bacterium]
MSPGQVDPGTYTVLVKQGDNWVAAGSVTVGAGQQVVVKCGFGRCKQER